MAGNFFNGEFFGGGFFGAVTPEADDLRNFSLRNWRKWRRPADEERRRKVGLSVPEAEVIADVAARQADDLARDEQQRIDELRGELKLRGLEMRSRHLQMLNVERGRLIDAELARRLQAISKARADDETALVLILAAAL